jgi:hypothetical protein
VIQKPNTDEIINDPHNDIEVFRKLAYKMPKIIEIGDNEMTIIEDGDQIVKIDNGGRRTGGDRRCFSYSLHLPERRSGEDRRSGQDRRNTPRFKP